MKILILVFVCIELCFSSDDGWLKIAPFDSSNGNYYDLFFWNADTGWLAGQQGDSISKALLIAKTSDGFSTWDTSHALPETQSRVVSFSNRNNGLCGRGNLFRTKDGGNSWYQVLGLGHIAILALEYANDSIVWATGNFSTIIKSTDGGDNWVFQDTGLEKSTSISGLSVIDSVTAYACLEDTLLVTYDGETWSRIEIPDEIVKGRFWDVHFLDKNRGWLAGSFRSLLYTEDGGQTWQDRSAPFDSDPFWCFDALDSLTIIAGTNDGAVLRSDDGGKTWDEQIARDTYSVINSIEIIDKKIAYVVGHYGVILKTTNGGVSYINEEKEKSPTSSFTLSQNYPNPFNPQTSINFSVPQKERVQINLYDISGKKVKTLLDENKNRGNHKLTFNLSDLASGLYLYRLQAGAVSITKKLVLLK